MNVTHVEFPLQDARVPRLIELIQAIPLTVLPCDIPSGPMMCHLEFDKVLDATEQASVQDAFIACIHEMTFTEAESS